MRYWKSTGLRPPILQGAATALKAYLDNIFPNVIHQRKAFGILPGHRIRWPRMIRELFTLRGINTDPLPATPVLCIYGRHDRLLQQMGFRDWSLYESLIARVCPNTVFQPMDGDHFFTCKDARKTVIAMVDRFLSD